MLVQPGKMQIRLFCLGGSGVRGSRSSSVSSTSWGWAALGLGFAKMRVRMRLRLVGETTVPAAETLGPIASNFGSLPGAAPEPPPSPGSAPIEVVTVSVPPAPDFPYSVMSDGDDIMFRFRGQAGVGRD